MGTVSSAAFVGMAAGVPEKEMGMAASGMYLFNNLGAISGTGIGAAVYQLSLKSSLWEALQGLDDAEEVGCVMHLAFPIVARY